MRIEKLYFKDMSNKIEINIECFSKFTLLVGVSGVGKTHIIRSIRTLKDIVTGNTEGLEGVEWSITFAMKEDEYIWNGKFESTKDSSRSARYVDMDGPISLPNINKETLLINGEIIVDRATSRVVFKGVKTPKVSMYKSFVSLFSEEKGINTVYEEVMKIYRFDYETERKILLASTSLNDLTNAKRYETISDLIKEHKPLIHKFGALYNLFPKQFNEIKRRFKAIFPNVTDIKFSDDFDDEMYLLMLKEKGTPWIPQYEFSSGMYKTLMVLVELMLIEDGSTILMDEIENSLGVNCIDEVVDEVLMTDRDIQLIATSHHPYIINSIDMSNWRIVTRVGSKINVRKADDINLGKSRHDAFKQLINSSVYMGITK